MLPTFRRSRFWLLLLLPPLAACGEVAGPGNVMQVVSGNNQVGRAGEPVSRPLAVRVLRADGSPASGTTVGWSSSGAAVSPTTTTTGSDGATEATADLGASGGIQTVRASLRDAPNVSVTFTLTAGTAPAPVLVAEVPIQPSIHDTYVRDGLAFVSAWNSGGVRIYDVGNGLKAGTPSNPVLVSVTLMPNPLYNGVLVHNTWWFWNPNTGEKRYLFVGEEGPAVIGQSSTGDIHVLDVSDLANPVKVASYHMSGTAQPAGTHNFWMDEAAEILYAGYYNGGVLALDVSGTLSGDLAGREITRINPVSPAPTYVWGVQLFDGSIYAADFLNGLIQLKLNGSSFTVAGGGINVPDRYTSDLWVHGSYAYTGTWSGGGGFTRNGNGGDALKIWQLGTTGAPVLHDSIILGDVVRVSDVQVSDDGTLLVLGAEREVAGGIYVYSLVPDPGKPRYLSRALAEAGVHTATVADIGGRRYVFAAKNSVAVAGNSALWIYDITALTP